MVISEQSRLMAAELAIIVLIAHTYGWQFLLPYAACSFVFFVILREINKAQSVTPLHEHLAHLEGRIEHLEVTLLGCTDDPILPRLYNSHPT